MRGRKQQTLPIMMPCNERLYVETGSATCGQFLCSLVRSLLVALTSRPVQMRVAFNLSIR